MLRTKFGSDTMLKVKYYYQRDVLYYVVYAKVDVEEET